MKEISIRGRKTVIPSFRAGENLVIVKGSALRVAEVFDEYWVEAKQLPHPNDVIARCRNEGARADLFTFAQRVPDSEPRHPYYHEWDNIAVIPLSTYEHCLAKQVTSATRRNIRGAENRGVVIRACEYDDTYVRGIMAIYNESPIRQGRRFWHYGKPFEAVRDENGTYADRATFLGAFIDGEMVGYLKMVWDERTAAIMQIMSKLSVYDKR